MMAPLSQKTLLITGATGLLGRHALAAWQHSHTLHTLVRTPPANQLPGVTYHTIDLSTEWDTTGLPNRIDAVLHLAQATHMRDFPARAREIYIINTDSTSRLLDYAIGAKAQHFIYTSTGGLYAPGNNPLTELSPIAIQSGPLAHYFATKHASELLVNTYTPYMHTIILRPFFMYGHGQRDSMLIPRLITRVKNNEPIILQGANGITINPLHVNDAVASLDKALTLRGSHTINIAGPKPITIRTVAELIGSALNQTPRFELAPVTANTLADITRMRQLLVAPQVTFADAITDLCIRA
ncbi:MAG: NAD-dependent epimerase/dehydratase family protein [Rickettsiales bacterium]